MAYVLTDIWNEALIELGSTTVISSRSQRGVEANVFDRIWDSVRDQFLAEHDWHWARKSQTLALSNDTPPVNWEYVYNSPVDMIMPRFIEPNEYRIPMEQGTTEEGNGAIFANQGEATLVYTQRLKNIDLWMPKARTACAMLLALRTYKAIAKKETPSIRATAYQRWLGRAVAESRKARRKQPYNAPNGQTAARA